jgi:hypothetical protein
MTWARRSGLLVCPKIFFILRETLSRYQRFTFYKSKEIQTLASASAGNARAERFERLQAREIERLEGDGIPSEPTVARDAVPSDGGNE